MSQSCLTKSRQPNIPNVAGQSITELGIIDRLKKRKVVKQLKLAEKEPKKRTTNPKLSIPSQNPAEKEDVEDEEQLTPPPAQRCYVKCKKCRKESHSDMMSC